MTDADLIERCAAVTPHQITAVIPTYRRPALLKRAVESVLAQTYPHLQVAVFDNASGDETAEVVQEIRRRDPRVRYHCHPANLGAARNFRAGLESVTTSHFAFLSDDDLVFPWFFEHATAHLARQPRARFFCGQSVRYEPDLRRHEIRPAAHWESRFYEAGEAVERMIASMFPWTAAVFATEVREQAGPLEDLEIADFLFMVKAAICFPFVVSLVPCAIRVYWNESALRVMGAEQVIRSFEVTAERLSRLAQLDAAARERLARILEAKLCRVMGSRLHAYFLDGDWGSVERAGEILTRCHSLTTGKRLRLWLARHRRRSTLPLRAARGVLRLRESLRRRRRAAAPVALDEILRRYAAPPSP